MNNNNMNNCNRYFWYVEYDMNYNIFVKFKLFSIHKKILRKI